MNFDALPALALFAFAGSVTPGPNNLMLMASGANYGFRRTLPHMAGISIGFMVMMILAGLGMVKLFDRFPVSYIILKTLSIAYMLYLVWKIATATPATADSTTGRPMTFLQAAAFQWVNPKAWAMALTVITVYLGKPDLLMLTIAAAVFVTVNLPTVTIWTVMGQQLSRILTNPKRLRIFNWTMATLLVASLYPLLQMG